MVRSAEVLVNFQDATQFSGKLCGESGISIQDYSSWYSKEWEYSLCIEHCYSRCINGLLTGEENCRFTTSVINYGQDAIKTIGTGKIGNEVHGDRLEGILALVC
jgi:hypothetical protein